MRMHTLSTSHVGVGLQMHTTFKQWNEIEFKIQEANMLMGLSIHHHCVKPTISVDRVAKCRTLRGFFLTCVGILMISKTNNIYNIYHSHYLEFCSVLILWVLGFLTISGTTLDSDTNCIFRIYRKGGSSLSCATSCITADWMQSMILEV